MALKIADIKPGFVTKECALCGELFTVDDFIGARQKYCGKECAKKAKKRLDRAYNKRTPWEIEQTEKLKKSLQDKPPISPEKVMEDIRNPKRKNEDARDYLAEDAIAARAAGMSYGQYTSQRYAPRLFKNS